MSVRVLSSSSIRSNWIRLASTPSLTPRSFLKPGRCSYSTTASFHNAAKPAATLTGARRIGQTAAMVTMATGGILAKPLIMQKHPVACQATVATPVILEDEQAQRIVQQQRSLFHKGELSFGTLLGLCTGYFLKKMGRLFALMVGMGFVCLQYMSAKGYVTVHWDRMQAGYNKQLDVDQDGRVTVRDVQSKWRKLVNLLTKNIQFKSTFLVGLYAGIRFG